MKVGDKVTPKTEFDGIENGIIGVVTWVDPNDTDTFNVEFPDVPDDRTGKPPAEYVGLAEFFDLISPL
jgi:hypothetical protein